MKPGVDPTSDSLISGLPTQSPTVADDVSMGNIPGSQVPPMPQIDNSFQTPTFPASAGLSDPQTVSPFASTTEPVQPQTELSSAPEPVSPFAVPSPVSPIPPTGEFNAQPIYTPQPIGTSTPSPQTTSPFDTPPAPPSQTQPVAAPINLGSTIVEEKPKKKAPTFLVFLLILVIIVLGAVGYLAYQNYVLNKKIIPNTTTTQTLTSPTVSADPYSGYTSYKSTILPIEFMIPPDWKAQDSEDKDLAGQKMIKVNSPDFSYQDSTISSGFEFRVGPVNDLIKKYDSFDALAAEINATNSYVQKTINGTPWLVGNTQATTLLDSKPLTVAIYSSTDMSEKAIDIFAKILNSTIITPVSPTNPSATSSALPL